MARFESMTSAQVDGARFSASLRVELRREQMALESALRVLDLTDPHATTSQYADVLVRWYRVISAFQPGADEALGCRWPEMAWLESDLVSLGRTPYKRWSDGPALSAPESLGYRYVIESQHRYHRLILADIRATLGAHTAAFSFYEAHGGRDISWRAILDRIDCQETAMRREVLVAGRATLVALEKALSAP